MALDAGLFILVGSAALWAILGIALLLFGGRSIEARPLGAIALGSGALHLGNNYLTLSGIGMFSVTGATWWSLIGLIVTVASVVLIRRWAKEDGQLARVPLGVAYGVLTAILASWAWRWGPLILAGSASLHPSFLFSTLFYGSLAPQFLVVGYASARAAVRPEPAAVTRAASIALGLGLLEIFAIFSFLPLRNLDPVADTLNILVAGSALAIVVVPWLVASGRGAGKAAVVAPLAFCITGLSALMVPLFTGSEGMAIGMNPARGVVRTMAWAAIAFGILRYDAVGLGLRPKGLDRGTLAAGALAALFIVAQIAQEFFTAEYGLLMGGVTAGVLLFAANPILRSMERFAGHDGGRIRAPGTPAPASTPQLAAEREETYREAVRLALRDHTLTREEERHLLRLAYHLGVPTPRAMEIHDEVEGEVSREEAAR